MKWYQNRFRRHLLDMHIDDWNDEFLAEFSPENYFQCLKDGKVQVAMIYLQSHLGYCNWPSKTAKVHNHFLKKPDDIKKLIDLCREDGIKVMGYYSVNFNTWAHDQHPDWAMKQENGLSLRENDPSHRYGHCCPNNMEYREFVFRQIDEMLDYFSLDGLFFDMLFWEYECYCPACRARYMAERGREPPSKANCTQEQWLDFFDSRAAWIGDWAQALTDHVHSVIPGLPVEHNFAAAASRFDMCCRDQVAAASEYVGGDRYGGPIEQSLECKCYYDITNNQPFEYMTSRCVPRLRVHTVTKSEDKLSQQVLLTCAHHGAFLAIDAIDPAGTMDQRVYERLGKVFAKEAVYEPYLTGELIADVGIFYNLDSGANLQCEEGIKETFLHYGTENIVMNNRTASEQALRHLIRNHIPCGVTSKKNMDRWNRYRVIMAPNINRLSDEVVDGLLRYVAEGGALYFNNCDEKRLFETLVGGKYKEHIETTKAYIYPAPGYESLLCGYNEKYPLPLDTMTPIVEGVPEENIRAYVKLAYTSREVGYCSSIHSDPPGISTQYPAIVETTYGKGRVIWSAGAIEFHGASDYGRVLQEILQRLDDQPFTVSSTAPKYVEIVSFRDGNKIRLSTVDLTDDDEFPTLTDFRISVRTQSAPKAVKRLSDGMDMAFDYVDGCATFTVSGMRIMEMFEIEE